VRSTSGRGAIHLNGYRYSKRRRPYLIFVDAASCRKRHTLGINFHSGPSPFP